MVEPEQQIFFSIVIPTRNRPELFLVALDSVLSQSFASKEVIVVNDGSTEPFLNKYKEIASNYKDVQFHYLVHRPNGHGQSYSMNFGASLANGRYLCFLDDDDFWTDDNYLQSIHDDFLLQKSEPDLVYSNQKAFFSDGSPNTEELWIEDLMRKISPASGAHNSAIEVDAKVLLSSHGFAHLNCSIFQREFYLSIGGMDEGIRYECDRDIYIRSIDAAESILYNPNFVSQHNIPDASKADNMSTLISTFEKKLYQLRVYEKGILLSRKAEIIEFCRNAKTYELKHVAKKLEETGNYCDASYYARQSLLTGFNVKWLIYTTYVSLKSLFSRR